MLRFLDCDRLSFYRKDFYESAITIELDLSFDNDLNLKITNLKGLLAHSHPIYRQWIYLNLFAI